MIEDAASRDLTMHRREFFAIAGGTLLPQMPVWGKPSKGPFVVGVLAQSPYVENDPTNEADTAFVDELARWGYVKGRNVVFVAKNSEGVESRLPALAAELVAAKVDVIFSLAGLPGVRAAKRATTRIPIVMSASTDPVLEGIVDSLAHPGGNVTGNSYVGYELAAKRFELLHEALGKPGGIAYLLANEAGRNNSSVEVASAVTAAAQSMGVQCFVIHTERTSSGFNDGLREAVRLGAVGVQISSRLAAAATSQDLADVTSKYRLPSMLDSREWIHQGMLMAYGPNRPDMARKAARYIAKLLNGTKAANLPIEQPEKFDLAINLRVARSLGLSLPRSVLVRATELLT